MNMNPCTAALAALCLVSTAVAQYSEDFETAKINPKGAQPLNGQLAFYNPLPAASISFDAHLYGLAPHKIPKNPKGGGRFVVAVGPGGSPAKFARSQRNIAYCKGDKWTVSFDVLANFVGTGTAGNNLGSFSLQSWAVPQTEKSFIALARWQGTGRTNWEAAMIHHSATNVQTTSAIPGTGFTGLKLNNWYRWELDFDLKTNLITEVRLTDLMVTTPTVAKHKPTAWYLSGGPNSTLKRPTGFRLFAGGTVAGNLMAFDNVSVALNGPGGVKGSVTTYGSGTGRPNPKGSLTVTGAPVIDTTVKVSVHNPLGTQSKTNTATLVAVGLQKTDPGIKIGGFGMNGGAGELLIGSILFTVPGPKWTGAPADYNIRLPPFLCSVVGGTVYLQGLTADSSSGAKAPVGLTEAVAVKLGNIK